MTAHGTAVRRSAPGCVKAQPHRRCSPSWAEAAQGILCVEPGPFTGLRTSFTPMLSPRLHSVAADAPPVADPSRDVVMAPLLDLDPELGRGLTPALREQVRRWLVVPVWTLPRGEWPADASREDGMMGLLVLEGVLARNVSLGRIAYPELLGPGDLLRPSQGKEGGLVPVDVCWNVIETCRVAVLDRRFSSIVCRWPEVVDELLGRALRRAREMDLNMAVAQLPLLELRLLGLLWHLADRWGRPCDDGVHVPVRLTHSLLAALVLGRRPSTSRALTELAQRGLITRAHDGWILH